MVTRKDLAASIEERIAAGEWGPGDRLPSTAELAAYYGVGQSTVFNAMDILKDRGVVTGQQGGRRYVAIPPETQGSD